jgi:hypothetical protein
MPVAQKPLKNIVLKRMSLYIATVTEVLVVIRRINDMIGGIFWNIPTNLGNLSCKLVHLQLGK